MSGGSEKGRASPAMLLLAHGTAMEPSTTLGLTRGAEVPKGSKIIAFLIATRDVCST